jgi:hypothetical protein
MPIKLVYVTGARRRLTSSVRLRSGELARDLSLFAKFHLPLKRQGMSNKQSNHSKTYIEAIRCLSSRSYLGSSLIILEQFESTTKIQSEAAPALQASSSQLFNTLCLVPLSI